MLLGAKQSVEDFVIQILAQHGDYTVEDLKAIISEQWKQDITIQGIYRVLRKLQSDGIVVKEKRFYSLRVPWILHVRELLDRMEDTYLKEKFLSRYLPSSDEEKYTWIFSSLVKLSDFYLQLLLALVHASEDKIIYQYHPHPWFNLPQFDQGQKFNTVFLQKTHYNFALIGSDTFLDKYSTAQWELFKNLTYHHLRKNDKPFDDRRGKYIVVVAPYILTITLDSHTTAKFDEFYTTIPTSDDLKPQDVVDMFTRKIRAKVVIKRDEEKIKKYTKRFKKIFGPPPKRFPNKK